SLWLDRITTGRFAVFGSFLNASSTPNPSSLGRRMSRKIMSGALSRASSRALSPSDATSTSYPSSSSFNLYISATEGSSSTNSTRIRSRLARDSSATSSPELRVRHNGGQIERPRPSSAAPSGNRRPPGRDLSHLPPPFPALRGHLGDPRHPERGPRGLQLLLCVLHPAPGLECNAGSRPQQLPALTRGAGHRIPSHLVARALHLSRRGLRPMRIGPGASGDHLGRAARRPSPVLRHPRVPVSDRADGRGVLPAAAVDLDLGGLGGGAAGHVRRERRP